MNDFRKEEINTAPLEFGQNQEILATTYFCLFYFASSPPLSLFNERNQYPNPGKMVLRDASLPYSWSVGFLNKIAIPCSKNLSLNLLACCVWQAV